LASLDGCVEARRQEMVRDLQDLIRIESVKGPAASGAPFGLGVRAALDFILERARTMGFATKEVDGYAGHVEFGAGREIIGVLVHLDVVPPGEGWTHPSFGGEIACGRLYGRGSIDDKGPAIACLHAMAALRETGFLPRRRLRLILGCDEESGSWNCVERYFAVEEKPLYGFAPDAEFPVITAEKGHLWLRAGKRWGGTQEGGLAILSVEGGTRPNVVPDRCAATLALGGRAAEEVLAVLRAADVSLVFSEEAGVLRVEARGRAAHASLPEQGENAIGRLFSALSALAGWLPEPQAETVRFLAESFGLSYDGAGLGLACRDGSGALTLNFGTISWDPAEIALMLDLRYPVSADKHGLLARLRERLAAIGLELEVDIDLPPLYLPPDHPLVRELLQVFREKTGSEAEPLAIGGRTFASAIGTGVAFGPVFPGRPELAHKADEYVDLEEFLLMAQIYAAAMAALAGG